MPKKKVRLVILLLMTSIWCIGQETINDSMLFRMNHWGISLTPSFYSPLFISRETGIMKLKSSIFPGFNFSFDKYFNFRNNQSLIVSLKTGMFPIVQLTDFSAAQSQLYHPADKLRIFDYGPLYISLPISWEWRKQTGKNYRAFGIGLNINYFPPGKHTAEYDETIDTAGNYQTIFYSELNINPKNNFSFGVNFSGTSIKILKNNNFLRLGIEVVLLPAAVAKGEYEFLNPPSAYYTYGKLTLNGSYLGFKTSYVFTKVKKMNRKKNS